MLEFVEQMHQVNIQIQCYFWTKLMSRSWSLHEMLAVMEWLVDVFKPSTAHHYHWFQRVNGVRQQHTLLLISSTSCTEQRVTTTNFHSAQISKYTFSKICYLSGQSLPWNHIQRLNNSQNHEAIYCIHSSLGGAVNATDSFLNLMINTRVKLLKPGRVQQCHWQPAEGVGERCKWPYLVWSRLGGNAVNQP